MESASSLRQNLPRRHPFAVKLRHVSQREDFLTVNVMFKSELKEERNEKAEQTWDYWPRKCRMCHISGHDR